MSSAYLLFGRPGSGNYAVQIALEELERGTSQIGWVRMPKRSRNSSPSTRPVGYRHCVCGWLSAQQSAAILIHLSLHTRTEAGAGAGKHRTRTLPAVDGVPVRECL